MIKLLSFLGIISLIGTSTTSLVACNRVKKYTTKELAIIKEKNKIKTTNQEIIENLEWITQQEKPFKQIDDKYYFVIWRGYKNADWRIIKFKNNKATINIDNNDNRQLEKIDLGVSMGKDLYITNKSGFVKYVTHWQTDSNTYFKTIYRWNGDNEPNINIENKLKSYLNL